ncbi:glycosyltransferase family 2 protein [Paraburkholderia sp. SG-MS1]|uniref:glycosyltransferase family 2 protein n=1 Tax=Paraburkholderia sp. SG-MS1 TaxID=2023741 RepID=UPI001444CF7A|nr:glycosyltransferase family A protein [Paraburkholderia sp. SG-MS1]
MMLYHHLGASIDTLRVAVVTPTRNRELFIGQTIRYFHAQRNPFRALRWFVLDDSDEASSHEYFGTSDRDVSYTWVGDVRPLGAKRNWLNDSAKEWGADIICSMDDDDWYGPDYLDDMATLLLQNEACFAGSGADWYFEPRGQRVLFIPAVREHMSCNAVLCYKAHVLDSRRYDEHARFGEEPAFIGQDRILQHPDIKNVHLALIGTHNTVTKRGYLRSPNLYTSFSLEDFPMEERDRNFYRSLMHKSASSWLRPE